MRYGKSVHTHSREEFRSIWLNSLCSLLLVALGMAMQGLRADTVRLAGSTSAIGTMRLIAAEFGKSRPQTQLVFVPDLNSGGAIQALIAGAIDIAMSSRPLKDEERSHGIIAVEYGRSPFVFATSAENPISGFTTAELAAIYAGRTQSWSDGRRIRLVLNPKDDPDTKMLKSMSAEMAEAVDTALLRRGMIMDASDGVRAQAIETIPGALGTSMLSLILSEKRRLKPLALNGITPTASSIADGSYPYYKTFFLVTRADPPPLAQQFIEFVVSSSGHDILSRTGHWVFAD